MTVEYTGEFWKAIGTPAASAEAWVDNLDVVLEVDLEEAFGWQGTRAVVYGLYNNGQSFGARCIGDLQGVSNIETGLEAARLFEAFMEQGFGDRASLLVGLYDLNSEFDVLDSSALFIHGAHGMGTDIAQTGVAGPSIFPASSLAVRLEYRWNDQWLSRFAVLDAVPGDPEDPSRTAIDLDREEGALMVGEFARESGNARLLAGGWRYTAAFSNESESMRQGREVQERGNHGLYLRGEWFPTGSLAVFGRVGWAEPRFNVFEWFASAGAVVEGPLMGQPDHRLGLAILVGEASGAFRRIAALTGQGAASRETALELTYELPINEHITVQPNLQYIINPGLKPATDNAWAVGLRMVLSIGGLIGQ